MAGYVWAPGFHPPKAKVEDVAAAIKALPDPSPPHLLDASKAKRHCLHEEFWAEGDQVWAQRGRLERARRIIASVCEVVLVGNREIETRVVEHLHVNGEPVWATMDRIIGDEEMEEALIAEIERLQSQATAKLARFRAIRKAARDK